MSSFPTLATLALQGRFVRLDPMSLADVPALLDAASEDRSSYGFTRVPSGQAAMRAFVCKALNEMAAGDAIPFTIRRQVDCSVIGTTRLLDLGYWRSGSDGACETPSVVEIGSTWLAASAQRTVANTEAKFLLLSQAFDAWACYRVVFQTDARNARSRAAIERLGARLEGVRRAHKQGSDLNSRDSAFYSLLADEWPAARAGLRARLENQ